MPIRTPLCDLFGIKHPVVLAPMAGVSGGELAAAVSHAGGLGLIGGGYGDADWLMREFDAASTAGDIDTAAVTVGEAVNLIRRREPAEIILQTMVSQAEDQLRCLTRLIEPIKED